MSSDNGESADDHRVESVLGFKYKLEAFIVCLGARFSSFCIEDGSQCLPAIS